VLRSEPLRRLVEIRVLATCRVVVVTPQGVFERVRVDSECLRHFRDGLPSVDERRERELWVFDVFGVDEQVGLGTGLVEYEPGGPRMVRVLGNEPPSRIVDNESGERSEERRGGKAEHGRAEARRGPERGGR